MPKKVPSEYTGRFSIKENRLSAPKRRLSLALPARKLSKDPNNSPTSCLEGMPSSSSASSTAITYGTSNFGDSPSRASNALSESYAPTSRSKDERGESPNRPPSPENGTERHQDAQAQAEDELVESYNMLHASIARTPGGKGATSQKTASPIEPEGQYEQKVYRTFASEYRHCTNSRQAVLQTADTLSKGAADPGDANLGMYIWGIVLAMKSFAMDHPESTDFLLSTFASTCTQFPETLTTEFGRGSAAGFNRLEAWIDEETMECRGQLATNRLAHGDMDERTNNNGFRYSDVTESPNGVPAEQIEERKKQRMWSIVVAGIQSRAFALDLMHISRGRQIEKLIHGGLTNEQGGWNAVEFTRSCVLLRGCAKRLVERDGATAAVAKREGLRQSLEGFLHPGRENGEDWLNVKAHATMALRNLEVGAVNETSDQLFRCSG